MPSIANFQPYAAYAAFINGMASNWSYIAQNISIIGHQRTSPLEEIIRSDLISVLTGRATPNDLDRDLFALPSGLGNYKY